MRAICHFKGVIKMFIETKKRNFLDTFDEWLEISKLQPKNLEQYKTADKFFVEYRLGNYCLMCIKNGQKQQIGQGLDKKIYPNLNTAFMWAGTFIDRNNKEKKHFGIQIKESLDEMDF